MSDEAMRAGANPAEPQAAASQPQLLNPIAAQPPAVTHASTRLEDNLDRADRLLALCETLATAPGPGQVGALQAAAKIMQANAAAAAAVLRLAYGETRHRSIVDRLRDQHGRLYSNFQEGGVNSLKYEGSARAALERRLNRLIEVAQEKAAEAEGKAPEDEQDKDARAGDTK
jgi:hypothetical protein